MNYPQLHLEERTFQNRLNKKIKAKLVDKVLGKVRGKIPARLGGTRGLPGPRQHPKVNAALIGVGNIAKWAYLPKIRNGNRFALCGVFDVNQEAAQVVADDFSATVYPTPEAIFEDDNVEAVLICAPPKFHCELAKAALDAGKHVLCEKPLASSHAEATAMWEAARTASTRHMVNFSYRYRADIAHFIDIVRSGMLGSVYYVTGSFSQGQWFTQDNEPSHERDDDAPWRYQAGGGVVFELGSHLIDLLRQCFGEVESVSAWSEPFRQEAPECENACGMGLKFNNGTMAHVVTSRMATGFKEHSEIEVTGTKGCLIYQGGLLRLWTRAVPQWRDLMLPPPREQDFLAAFHNAIHEPAKVVPGFWDGLKNNEVIEAIYKSADEGVVVTLPLAPPSA